MTVSVITCFRPSERTTSVYAGRMARIDSAILAFLGVLLAHEIAYLTSSIAGFDTSVSHGHLRIAWLAGSLSLLSLLARSVIKSLRRRSHDGGNMVHLAGFIGFGYTLLEQFERALDGYGAASLFIEPVFWFGLAAAPLVALVLSWSLRSLEEAVAKLLEPDALKELSTPCRQGALGVTSLLYPCTPALSTVVSRRGPPLS